MGARVFLNLPVKDLKRSVEFFGRLGFHLDPRFSDDKAACLALGPDTRVMLLVSSFFETFTTKPIVDARQSTEALIAVAVGARSDVDRVVGAALEAGARPVRAPEDHGFIYSRTFEDLDGHLWELFWMDPVRLAEGAAQDAGATEASAAELVMTRIFEAPREFVYAAWTQPQALQRWLGVTLGACREAEPGERLVFAAGDGDEHVTVTLAAAGRRTRVTVRETLPRREAYALTRERSWSDSLKRLGALVEPGPPGP
jgi:hypothetical protein